MEECNGKVESEDVGRLSIAQDTLRKNFSRESLRQSVEWEISSYRTCVLNVVAFRSRTTFGGSPVAWRRQPQEEEAVQLVVCRRNHPRRSGRADKLAESAKSLGRALLGKNVAFSGPLGSRRRTTRMASSSSSLFKKEPVVLKEMVDFSHIISVVPRAFCV